MPAMDNTRAAQPINPSPSPNETIAKGPQTITNASSISPSTSYRPDCPICNPPDTKSTNFNAYGTIEPLSYDTQLPLPSFLEASLEACAEICCYSCGSPPPSVQTSEWSSTPYPSSLSSNSHFYDETEAGPSEGQTSNAEIIHAQNAPRDDDGYKKQQEMQSIKDDSIAQYPPKKAFQQSE